MADEKAWRKRLLNYKIYWKTLPKPRKGSEFALCGRRY